MNAIVKMIREQYAEAHDGDMCPLSDKEILAVVEATPGQAPGESDEMDMQRMIAIDAAVEAKDEGDTEDDDTSETTVPSSVAVTPHQKTWARQAAAKIGAAFEADLAVLLDADEKKKQSSVVICDNLVATFGDELYGFPVVNSTDEDVKDTNGTADKYTLKIIGSDKKERGSFWGNTADNSKTGKAIQAKLDLLELSKTEPVSDKLPTEWKKLGKPRRDTLFAKFRGQQSSLRNLFRKGAQLAFKLHDIATELPGVYCAHVKDGDGKVIVSPKPFHIGDKSNLTQVEAVSAQQLLSYQITPDVIAKGTAEALMATAEREKKDATAGLPAIENSKQATDFAAVFSNYYDMTTGEGETRAATLAKSFANPKTDDHTIETWVNMGLFIGDVYNAAKAESDKRKAARDAAARKKAA